MSHLHIPDGILPIWLWVSGYIIVALYLLFAVNYIKNTGLNRKFFLVGMCSAFMIVAMSIEIVPISYHINLSALSGIILGPVLAPLAIIVANLFLALMGHGGITVLGLNTIAVSLEAVCAFYIFKLLKNRLNKPVLTSAFIAVFVALFISSSVSIGITYAGTGNLSLHSEHETASGIIKFEGREAPESQHNHNAEPAEHLNIKKFILIVFAFGLIGWTIESFLTSFIINYIYKVKPDILNT